MPPEIAPRQAVAGLKGVRIKEVRGFRCDLQVTPIMIVA
jgi:hypothetical protein